MNANYRLSHGYRTEEVGLRPRGNTVTVDVPSDNPFEDELAGAPVTVVTQASGGVAKAPRRHQSRKIMHKGAGPALSAAHVRQAIARRNAAPPARMLSNGFIPGMGELGDDASYRRFLMRRAGLINGLGGGSARIVYAVKPRQPQQHDDFLPGMGDLGADVSDDEAYAAFNQYDSEAKSMNRDAFQGSAKLAYWRNQVSGWKDAAAAKSAAVTTTALTTTGNVISELAKSYTSKQGAKIASAQSMATQAQADAAAKAAGFANATEQAKAESERARSASQGKSSMTKWYVGGGVVVAVAVVALLLMSKRKTAV